MDITKFLDENYKDAALYILYRQTASYVDGLKNAARKAVFTVKKTGLKSQLKVTAFGSEVIKEAEYLHGEVSIQGTTVTMAADFCGANNLPILRGIGSFGTRFVPVASAPRYIFVRPPEYFDLLFKKADDVNLVEQNFEGKKIDPVFYVPTLPVILLNGTEGIGVGFASDILPRSIENVIKLTRAAIKKEKLKDEWFVPNFHGFTGEVKKGLNKKGEPTWYVTGRASRVGKKVTIEEIPMTYDLAGYRNYLYSCRDKDIITKFYDFSEDDNFKFEVILDEDEAKKKDEEIWDDLGLVTTMPENLNCIDENNVIREYNDIKDIFRDYFNIKIKYLKLRIKSEVVRLKKEESDLKETYDFIQEVIKGTVVLKNKKKADVEAELKKKGYTIIERLVAMPLYSITADKAKEIEKRWKDKVKERQAMEKEEPENFWLRDIDELEAELKKEGFIGVTPEKKTTKKKETKNGKK